MIAQTPTYIAASTEYGSSEFIITQLRTIQESINNLLASSCVPKVERAQNVPYIDGSSPQW